VERIHTNHCDALNDRIAIIRKEAQREARHRAPALYVESPKQFAKKLTGWIAEQM